MKKAIMVTLNQISNYFKNIFVNVKHACLFNYILKMRSEAFNEAI